MSSNLKQSPEEKLTASSNSDDAEKDSGNKHTAIGGNGKEKAGDTEIQEDVDEGLDQSELYEQQQQHLFRVAERKRQQRERIAQNTLSSKDIAVMRSGLSNARECNTPSELRILNGEYPEGLRGSLYMVGPGRIEIKYNVQQELEQATKSFVFGNIMDALPLLTKISFDPNSKTIVHKSQLLAKQLADQIHMEHGVNPKTPGSLYMTDTNQIMLTRLISLSAHQGAASQGECCGQSIELFVPMQGTSQTVVCTNHVGGLQNIDPVTLNPRSILEIQDINPTFKGKLSTPHMQYDSNTREHLMVTQDVGFRNTTYKVVAISEAQPEGYVVAKFDVPQASIIHSFAITQDYVVVPVYPYKSTSAMGPFGWKDSLLENLLFDSKKAVLFYVISREYRRVQCIYHAPSFFAMHQINATQDAAAAAATDSISIDLVAYEDDTILKQLQIKELRCNSDMEMLLLPGDMRRYQLKGVTMEASRYVESPSRPATSYPLAHRMWLRDHNEALELPHINPMFATKPYAYVYGLSHVERLAGHVPHANSSHASIMYNSIVKMDISDVTNEPLVWSRKHCYPGEPVFVPRSGNSEDDGYILSVFFDSMRITSCLVVLDAQTFKELMIAQLPTPVPISFGHTKFTI